MNLISKKYFLLFLLTVSLSGIYPQENYKEIFSGYNPNPIILQDHLQLKELNLISHLNDFVNPQKANVQDNQTIIDSIIYFGADRSKSKRTYTYDEKGRITSYLILYLYNSEWENGWQITHSYDSLGNLLNILNENWNGINWENSIYQTFSYDSIGNNTLHLLFLWGNNNWQNILRISKTYDSVGNMITSTTEKWIDSTWINSLKITLNYYPNGMRDFNIVELWNGSNWEYFILLTFKYTNDWELLSLLYKIWDGDIWNNNSRTTFTYSLDEPQLIGLNEIWDNSQWIVHSRYSYSYNANGYFAHGIYELWENGNWVPFDGGIITIENPDGFIEHLWTYEAFVYYGKPTSADVEGNFLLKDFELSQNYPNPFNPSTTIKFQIPRNGFVTLKVYDVLGNEVATLVSEEKPAGSYKVEFDGSNLASGIYIYRLTSGNYTASKKLILLK